MSNIDMTHEWIAFDVIADFFPGVQVTMNTRMDELPLGKEMLPALHKKLGETFSNGMPELERLDGHDTVGSIVHCIVNSVAAWRRMSVARYMATRQSSSWFSFLFARFRRT